MTSKYLPLPSFVNLDTAAKWDYRPNVSNLLHKAKEWYHDHAISPAGADKKKTILLLIDWQRDLCLPEGALFASGGEATQLPVLDGAVKDTQRITTFIYNNIHLLTDIVATLNTHLMYHISSPTFWKTASGFHPDPYTIITLNDIKNGAFLPNLDMADWLCGGNKTWLKKQIEFYLQDIAYRNREPLTLWPTHCLLGTEGHNLVGLVDEARQFHALLRGSQTHLEIRGTNSLTEQYSIIKPEVSRRHDGVVGGLAQKNTTLIQRLLEADNLIIAGQAMSHSVRLTIEDILAEIKNKDEKMINAKRLYLLTDCTSPIIIKDKISCDKTILEYSNQIENSLQHFTKMGVNFVKADSPIQDFPEIRLK